MINCENREIFLNRSHPLTYGKNMRNQKLIGILAIAIFALNLALPFAYAQEGGEVEAADLHSWYTTVPGVLDSDTYVLYPYELKSLKVGFSKYGELIGIPPGQDMNVQANWVGLEYDGRDPFCPPTYIPMKSWINGWYIDIQYIDPALQRTLRFSTMVQEDLLHSL
jgi:hypothetical protein